MVNGGGQAQLVQSKIIGNFVPRNSTNMQQTQGTNGSLAVDSSGTTARILELVERATAAVNVTNKF